VRKIIECVPNFSEGRDPEVIRQITDAIAAVSGVSLLDVDPGAATNRTVVTFVGDPDSVVEAAFVGIQKAASLIDMSKHSGEHPRFGATDVCPFVPVAGADMQDCIACAQKLGKRVGEELGIPVYLYEEAATEAKRQNLASVRAGEYEGIAEKIVKPEWKPDFGPAEFQPKSGNIAIGAREFLIAFNVNLNTTSTRRANSVAFDVREAGRVKREGNPITGAIVKDENGESVRIPGACKSVKGIGWFIEEYGIAQISMNLTKLSDTPLHIAFDECVKSAHRRGLRVTGSELVGLIPLEAMLDAGRYFLSKQQRSLGVDDAELIKIAIKSMGLDELTPFDPQKNIIEYMITSQDQKRLASMSLTSFANETASESPAPGGGSIAAYVGSLGAALGGMVANLSAHKRGWDDRWEEFSKWAEKGQEIKDRLLFLVDEDTRAFDGIMAAVRLPKSSAEEKAARKQAMEAATQYAMKTPFMVMEESMKVFELCRAMAEDGNPNSVSDAGVGALCARAAVRGAYLNVLINAQGIEDQKFADDLIQKANKMLAQAEQEENAILDKTEQVIKNS
jgi:glutamate formiminotransferase/formiminotetrahydrofolate cyclodeaminase